MNNIQQSLVRFATRLGLPVLAFACSFLAISCTKNIDVEIPKDAQRIAVEGTIETGQPPIILLTNSQAFFDNINVSDLGAYFVHDANISVKVDNDSVQLVEYCLNNLPVSEAEKKALLQSFGFNPVDSIPLPNFCIYSIPDLIGCILSGSCAMLGQEEKRYDLRIQAQGKTLTSYTTIPKSIGIDSLSVRPRPNPLPNDKYFAVYNHLTVPNTFGNFVRYWTKRNSEPFYVPGSQSVWDDKLFIGLSIALPVERGYARGARVEPEDYSFFERGDTVTVKWANIDSRTYDFYFTLENDGGGSPFASPVIVKSNINGGLGVWAGYATRFYTIIVPN